MGNLSYFLGVEVQPHPNGLFLSQCKYVSDVLHRAQMAESKGVATPMCPTTVLTKKSGYLLSSPTTNRQLVGSLQYLSLTRPDVAFAVNKLSQYMQAPTSEHWASLKHLLRYLNGTADQGVVIYSDTPSTLHCFSDADWARDKDDYASTTGSHQPEFQSRLSFKDEAHRHNFSFYQRTGVERNSSSQSHFYKRLAC
ncbi:hypothetical protein V2J09_003420 [Rumex salicifolius]